MSGYLYGIPDDLEQRAATLAQWTNMRRLVGTARLDAAPPRLFVVPSATTVTLDVFELEPTFTVHEPGTTTFAVGGGIFSAQATGDGHFHTGAWSSLVDFDRDSPGVNWTLNIEVGFLMGTGGEVVARTIQKTGIVSNQGVSVSLNHHECAAGPDSPIWALFGTYDGTLQVRYRVSHDSGQAETMTIKNALVCVHPVAGPQVF